MKVLSSGTKTKIIGAILFVAMLVVAGAYAGNRIISDSSDNSITFITNSNGGHWEATGANLQIAIDNLSGTGNEIHLPPNAIIESSTYINISCSNIIIDGHGATIKATGDVVGWGMLYSWKQNNITIRNLILDANNIARRTLYFRGLHNIEGFTLENVETRNTITGYVWSGLVIGTGENYSVSRVKMINCYIHNHSESTKDTVVIGRTNDLYISGCTFENIGKNVFTYGGAYHKIIGNHFVNATKVNLQGNHTIFSGNTLENTDIYLRGFEADGGADSRDTTYVTISNNEITDGVIHINSGIHEIYKIRITGNDIIYKSDQSSLDSNGIVVQNTNETEILFNTIEKAGRSGIMLSNASEIRIKGNILRDNAVNTTLVVRGNIVDFDVTHPCDNITIENNLFDGENVTVLYHIWLRGDYNRISENEFLGKYTQAVRTDGNYTDRWRNRNYNYSYPNHFGNTTDFVDINETGYLTLHGDGRVARDLWVDVGGIKAPGLKPAEFVESGLTGVWQFGDEIEANQESVSGTLKIPSDMDRTVVPTFKIGWSADGVSPGNCHWQLEYLWVGPNDDSNAAAQETLTATGTASSTSNGTVITAFSGIDLPSSTDQAMFFRITRLSANVADTISDTVEMRGRIFSYTADSLGGAI